MYMEKEIEEDILYMQTFGGLSITWNGQSVLNGVKSMESQFVYLLEYMIHNRKKGVSREELQKILFDNREINNVHHAMQSVLYNAKKKLQKAGLPDVNYFVLKDGKYYWSDEIPVIEDATQIDEIIEEVKKVKDLDERLGYYMDICHIYQGEFLPNRASELWAAKEAGRYRKIFSNSVDSAVALLRINQDYFQMEELGIHAAKVNPLSDWEVVTMEALAHLHRYDDAKKLYDDTVELYFLEQGVRPSAKLMNLFDKLGAKLGHQYDVLDDIQNELSDNKTSEPGGYLCSFPIFQGIYQMVERMMERGGQSVYLMMCTVVDSKGNPMKDSPLLDELSQRLGDAIRHSIRHGDALNQYSKGKYLVLLVNTSRENCNIVQKRINERFIMGRQRTGIRYYVNSVICSPGGKIS